jgi:K+-sensing histidine kinase KdpD
LFAITDTGIAEDELEYILKTFNKQQIVFKNIWRHRLGLGISKQLIEKQGGTISVTSKINEGQRLVSL